MRLALLDRDGVVVRFPGRGRYVLQKKQMVLIPAALKGIRLLTEAGFQLHIVSNQGCVSHGYLTRARLSEMTRDMLRKIRRGGGRIHRVHYCIHRSADRCACKKPKTLLLRNAVQGSGARRRDIYFVGDSEVDVQAGKRFGCKTILVLSGRVKKNELNDLPAKPDLVKKDLYEAARWILRKNT